MAAIRSSGTTIASTSSRFDQEPLALARSIASSPAGVIRPSAISRSTFSLLIFDQLLFGLRGAKYCLWECSSTDRRVLSIQPKQRASSTASLQARLGLPLLFFQQKSQTPGSWS